MIGLAALALAVPLHFERASGPETCYWASAAAYSVWLSDTAVTMRFPSGGHLQMNLPQSIPRPEESLPGRSNYYGGSDPLTWRTNVAHYARIHYRHVFSGVDLAVYGRDGQVEYDWLVSPSADPARIRFSFSGAESVRLDEDGELVLGVAGGEVRHRKPSAYQLRNGSKSSIAVGYRIGRDGRIGFRLGPYDRRRPLVIDPVVVFAVGFGGGGYHDNRFSPGINVDDAATSIARDRSGNIYVGGTSVSSAFPLVQNLGPGPICHDCLVPTSFVAKLSPDGKTLLYSTYLAGGDFTDGMFPRPGVNDLPYTSFSIAADLDGNVYATGTTSGKDFPQVGGGIGTTAGFHDAFVVKLGPTGTLLASVLIGGSFDDAGGSIALGSDGAVYIAGVTASGDFPTTPGAYRRSASGGIFVLKLRAGSLTGSKLASGAIAWSTYLDLGAGPLVATDAGGNAYIAASTTSPAWPTAVGALQPQCAGSICADAIVAKLDPTGARLLYASYFGGSGKETVGGLFVDASGSIYVSGTTTSTDLPVTAAAFQRDWSPSGNQPAAGFVAKFTPDVTSTIYATYLAGKQGATQAHGLAVDAAGVAYVAGETVSRDFPIKSAFQVSLRNWICQERGVSGTLTGREHYCPQAGTLTALSPSGNSIVWSTLVGGGAAYAVALDSSGNVYAAGQGPFPDASRVAPTPTSTSVGVVKIAPQQTGLQFSWDGITNAASFQPGLPPGGGLASLFVEGLDLAGDLVASGYPLPTELAGVSVLVNGEPAPILSITRIGGGPGASGHQINFQVPFRATGTFGGGLIEARYRGLSTWADPTVVGPGIFTFADGSPAIQHASDYSLVTAANPAVKGETIIIYATGLGDVGSGQTGMPATQADSVGGCPGWSARLSTSVGLINIQYAGVTPGFVGLYQMNLQVPTTISSGNVDLQIGWGTCFFSLPVSYGRGNVVKLPIQ